MVQANNDRTVAPRAHGRYELAEIELATLIGIFTDDELATLFDELADDDLALEIGGDGVTQPPIKDGRVDLADGDLAQIGGGDDGDIKGDIHTQGN